MTRIHASVYLDRPAEEVFAYVTTPGYWPQWHPSSRGVSGATDHPLDVGEQVGEAFHIGWRRGHVLWTVRAREAPRRWVIAGRVAGGGEGTITYTLTPREGGTDFERTFVYAMPNRWLALLDRLVIRRIMAAESARALRRLKAVLEAVSLRAG